MNDPDRDELARQAEQLAAGNAEIRALSDKLHETVNDIITKSGIPTSINRLSISVVAMFVAVLLAGVGSVVSLVALHRIHERDRQDAQVQLDRRITGRGQAYANCEENNAQNQREDQAYQTTIAGVLALGADPARTSAALDILRNGLNLSDCDAALGDLTPAQRDEAKRSAAAIPRQPLPPPTIPGYVPPTTTTTTTLAAGKAQ